jgi:alcohol dehydrogenase class IV
MEMWFFGSPNMIVFGEEALGYLREVEGKRIFIVTGKTVTRLGLLDIVLKQIRETGMESRVFSEVEPEPSRQTVEKGAGAIAEFEPDWILGLGGGSSIDAAKAMWVLYERPDLTLEDINPFTKLGLRKKARMIAVPTTSGTGAEANWATIITDKERRVKLELASREIVPDIAILDPLLAADLPSKQTADTGMDALVHAIEAYTSQWKNDFSDAYALKAISLIMRFLPRAFKKGRADTEAREKMHNAATMAGMAFGNSQAGLVHAMAHSLGPVFNIPHGRCVAVFLPYVMEYNLRQAKQMYSEIAWSLGTSGGTDDDKARALIDMVRTLLREVDEPLSLREYGITDKDFAARLDELVEKATESACSTTSCRVPVEDDYRRLFQYAHTGRQVDF